MAEAFVRVSHPGIEGDAIVALAAVPGYAARGWLVLDAIDGGGATEAPPALTRPAGNASADAWRTYAVAAYVLGAADGLTYEQAMASSRDELVAHFAPLPDLTDPTDHQES